MSARSSLALIIAALVLTGTAAAAAAEDRSTQDPTATRPAAREAVSERGLQSRIPLAANDEQVYVPSPAAAAEPAQANDAQPEDGLDISELLALDLNPTHLRSPNEAGRSRGHGDVVLSLPLNDALDLRTGVRVDYDSSPSSQRFDAEAIPTIGVGFEF